MCAVGLIKGMQSGIDWKKTALQRAKNKENISQPPPRQATSSGSTGLSIQSRPSARTGSGTKTQAKAKTKARQTRTKRFTTR